MRQNGVKAIWADGGAVINGWLAIPSSYATEVMAHTGFDSLTIDMQHGLSDYQAALGMLAAISTTDTVAMARVTAPRLGERGLRTINGTRTPGS